MLSLVPSLVRPSELPTAVTLGMAPLPLGRAVGPTVCEVTTLAEKDRQPGKPTRVKYETRDGKKVRVAQSGKLIAEPQWTRREKKTTEEDNQ